MMGWGIRVDGVGVGKNGFMVDHWGYLFLKF
jgi:hypothetical protein